MTLEKYKKAILFQKRDLSGVLMSDVGDRVSAYSKSGPGLVGVEETAILFYLLNTSFGKVCSIFDKKEDLPAAAEKMVVEYLEKGSEITARLFYYMFLITSVESRYAKISSSLEAKIKQKFGDYFWAAHNQISAKNAGGIEAYLKTDKVCLSKVTLGTYLEGVVYIFKEASFSGGYGGPPWANITETLFNAIKGITSLEIMADTAWTLAHNNGPMFNKGILYHNYNSDIYKILDVQRSGQIAELIAEKSLSKYNTPTVINAYDLSKPFFGDSFTGYVDWYKVEALGSLKTYTQEKKNQSLKYGSEGTTVEGDKFFVTETEYAIVVKSQRA